MFRLRDWILVLVNLAGVVVGVAWPGFSGIFTPVVVWFLMTLLFLSFLNVDFAALFRVNKADLLEVSLWGGLKLILLPLACWAVTALLAPRWALPVLVVSGVSTGVTSPFFAGHLGADVGRVLKNVMLTSLLVPFTLPFLVSLLMGGTMYIPVAPMSAMLAKVIFIPLAAAWAVKRFLPLAVTAIGKVSFPLSVLIFFLNNLGIFAQYADFLKSQVGQLVYALLLSCVLALVYGGLGAGVGLASKRRFSPLTGAVSMVFINNVLAVVFGGQFFGPETPLLAAAYLIPLYSMVLPLRLLADRLEN